jgi:isopentenyldiphosphate isomerase
MNPSTDMYEVLDEQGHKTERVLDRQTVHSQQLWHEVVNVWVVNSRGEILMQLRAPEVEISPDVWDVTVGTHLRPQEAPQDAALRALKSEFSFSVVPAELKHLFNIQSANPLPNGATHNVFGHVFLLHSDPDISKLSYDKTKIADLAWVPLNRLMAELGGVTTKNKYFPRANNYYPQLFEAFQAWM